MLVARSAVYDTIFVQPTLHAIEGEGSRGQRSFLPLGEKGLLFFSLLGPDSERQVTTNNIRSSMLERSARFRRCPAASAAAAAAEPDARLQGIRSNRKVKDSVLLFAS